MTADYLNMAQWLITYNELEKQNAPGMDPFTGRKIGAKTEEPELVRHNARAWARERGHDLGRWASVPKKSKQWKAGCRRCGGDLIVTLDENNNPTYSGEASKGKCPGIHG